LDDQAKLKSWLFKITNNTIVDYYRKRKYSKLEITQIEPENGNDIQNVNMNDEMVTCLKSFLYELPDKYKIPLEMFEFNGMKHREISEKLNITLSGSKTRIQRAREKLKEVLTECCEMEFDTYGNILEYKQKESYQCLSENSK
jgi:RNA polymerase sigma-70 factor (ECF subfamily)